MREQLLKIVKNPVSASAIVGVITFGAGAGVGYILGRRKRFEIFEPPPRVGLVLDAEDLAELEENDHNLGVVEDDEEPESDDDDEDDEEEVDDVIPPDVSAREFIAERLKERLPDLVYEDGQDEEIEPIPSNIFAGNNDDWNYEEELAHRNPSEPYVIHKDEFWNEESGFDQTTLTWYAGDEMLADQENDPIYNYSDVIGPFKFGHGSGDPNVFFVRNEKTKAEFEIIFDPGHYKVEVLGYEIEDDAEARDMKHSNSPRRFQKME